jgi:hypothetical protein
MAQRVSKVEIKCTPSNPDPGIFGGNNPFARNVIYVENHLPRAIIVAVASDPNATRISSMAAGVSGGGVNGAVTFFHAPTPTQFILLPPLRKCPVKIVGNDAWVTTAAKSQSRSFYYVLDQNRYFSKGGTVVVHPEKFSNSSMRVLL